MRMRLASIFLLLFALSMSTSAGLSRAQDSSPDRLRAQAAGHSDLKFSSDAKKLGSFSTLGNAVFQPDGVGPFPAIVVVHSCGGINERSRYWTEEFLKRGYVVLVIDSFGPRGVTTNCGPKRRVSIARSVKDAFDASRSSISWTRSESGSWARRGEVPWVILPAVSSGLAPSPGVRGSEPSSAYTGTASRRLPVPSCCERTSIAHFSS